MFIEKTDAEAEAPILWPPDVKTQLIGEDTDAGKDWRQEEKEVTEDEMVGWHHRHDGHEFEKAPGVGDGQGSLACCGPWGRKESDTTDWLNWTELIGWKVEAGWLVILAGPDHVVITGESEVWFSFQDNMLMDWLGSLAMKVEKTKCRTGLVGMEVSGREK